MRETTPVLAAGCAALLLAVAAHAEPAAATGATDAKTLAQTKHCFVCHEAKTQKFGPSFRDISHRFGGLRNAKTMLKSVIQAGSDTPAAVYHWGASTMPPDSVRVPVSDAEADVLADYVLSFK